MRILFTGASSFTGFWFVRELVEAGHQVIATFQKSQNDYSEVRGARVANLLEYVEPIWSCSFGDRRFSEVVNSYDSWDVLCHHAAHVANYKRLDFDAVSAVKANTRQAREVLSQLNQRHCRQILLTGSVFEPGEGAGSDGLPAFSPYGLSKSLTWQLFRYYCTERSLPIRKFVIPNPFGPFEDHRFTSYLVNSWKKGEIAKVNTPDYVRDNIHISLLAKSYRQFAERDVRCVVEQFNPSGYVESQGQFALRVASEVRRRSSLSCDVHLADQTEFSEPRVRINTDAVDRSDWLESKAWDEFSTYYSGGNS